MTKNNLAKQGRFMSTCSDPEIRWKNKWHHLSKFNREICVVMNPTTRPFLNHGEGSIKQISLFSQTKNLCHQIQKKKILKSIQIKWPKLVLFNYNSKNNICPNFKYFNLKNHIFSAQ